MQTTAHLLMIRPVAFRLNLQTLDSNSFQDPDASQTHTQQKALEEFDAFVEKLRAHQVDVTVIEDTEAPHTPDSIFPNNWISLHHDGSVYLYPMEAKNRRPERREDILDILSERFDIREVNDLSFAEEYGEFLEGTGSMVLDHDYKIAYCCLSSRTHPKVLNIFCNESGYRPITFKAFDQKDVAIYHTNVMMSVGKSFALICLQSVTDMDERQHLVDSFKATGKEFIEISLDQMLAFAGNMLEITNNSGEHFIVMSDSAFTALSTAQKNKLSNYGELLHSSLKTIEENGGGSARCMLAEIHLPLRKTNIK